MQYNNMTVPVGTHIHAVKNLTVYDGGDCHGGVCSACWKERMPAKEERAI